MLIIMDRVYLIGYLNKIVTTKINEKKKTYEQTSTETKT